MWKDPETNEVFTEEELTELLERDNQTPFDEIKSFAENFIN